ncbi:MAG: thioesterase domain-containing protein, partial [Terrimicrobiaceae bacterium]|nr:thioesterase domain-containing protein [Terrimicrobiaceae bacterium]
LPGRALPRDIIRVSSIPRRHGLPDRAALDPPAPSPPPAGSQPRAPEAEAGKGADSPEASPEATAKGRAAAGQDAPAPAVKSQGPGSQSLLLDLAGRAELPRLIFIHASGRSPRDCAPLLPHLAQDWHVCGIRHYQGDPPDLTQLARGLAAEPACAEEPFHLLGVGAGGLLAFDLARALRAAGREVPFLLIAGAAPPHERPRNWIESLTRGFRAESSSPLHGPCGIILTKDLPRDAERRWLELAPDALCLSLDCRYQDLLGEAAGLLAEAISSFTSVGE